MRRPRRRNARALPTRIALCEMDDITERLTRAGGYARYEVSNWSLGW